MPLDRRPRTLAGWRPAPLARGALIRVPLWCSVCWTRASACTRDTKTAVIRDDDVDRAIGRGGQSAIRLPPDARLLRCPQTLVSRAPDQPCVASKHAEETPHSSVRSRVL